MTKIVMLPSVDTIKWPLSLADWHAQRLALAFNVGTVSFASFEESDTLALLEIRNDPTVLPFMPSHTPLQLERHRAWVKAHLLSRSPATPLLMLGRDGGRAAAFGLIKPTSENKVFEIGVVVAGKWQRGNLPARLATAMASAADSLLGARELLTYVNPLHDLALRFNRAWGLREAASNKCGELCFRAATELVLSTPLHLRCSRELELKVSQRH